MKHRVALIGVLASAVCLVLALTGCAQNQTYTPETLNPTVSSPTIGKDGTLRVGISGGAPFVVNGSDGATTGLDVDMAAALANQLGLKLEIVSLGTSGSEIDIESALAKGDVDIVMGATSSDKTSNVWVSDPYTQTAVALFATEGTQVPSRDSSPKIAAQSSLTSAWAVTNSFGDDSLVAKSDLLSALSAVETGDCKYLAADAVIGTYAALCQSVDVEPIAVLGSVGGYCVAASSSNTALQTALADALSAITTNGVVKTVCTKWLGSDLDLTSLPTVEVSTSASSSLGTSSDDAEESDEVTDASSSSESVDGAAPNTEAGANAVLPNSTTGATGSTTTGTGATSGSL